MKNKIIKKLAFGTIVICILMSFMPLVFQTTAIDYGKSGHFNIKTGKKLGIVSYNPDNHVIANASYCTGAQAGGVHQSDYSYDPYTIDIEQSLDPQYNYVTNINGGNAFVDFTCCPDQPCLYSSAGAITQSDFTLSASSTFISTSTGTLHEHSLYVWRSSVPQPSVSASGFHNENIPSSISVSPLQLNIPFTITETGYGFIQKACLSVLGDYWHDDHKYGYSHILAEWKIIDLNNNIIVADSLSVGTDGDFTDDWIGEREFIIEPGNYQFIIPKYKSQSYASLALSEPGELFAGFMSGDNFDITIFFRRHQFILGDINDDGFVNTGDIDLLVSAIAAGSADQFYELFSYGSYWAADINHDGLVNTGDIDPFVHILSNI